MLHPFLNLWSDTLYGITLFFYSPKMSPANSSAVTAPK